MPRFLAYGDGPLAVAHRLLGQRLVRVVGGERRAGLIVEVEAYLGEQDRAAHTFGGRRTRRNRSMYLAGGHAYVYFTYGMHHCLNVVCGGADEGVAVLIRALEPVEGVAGMRANRPRARRPTDVASGPGKLTQALAIDLALDGADLRSSPELFIEQARARRLAESRVARRPRIGVAYAGEWAERPYRLYVRGNPHVSTP